MKIGQEKRKRLARGAKAPEVLRQENKQEEVRFSPDRDLGEAYRQALLQIAEEYLREVQGEMKTHHQDEFSALFSGSLEEREPWRAIPYLAAHKLLFPKYQAELDALLTQYNVNELVGTEAEGLSFIEGMILFPEQKAELVKRADQLIKDAVSLKTGAGLPIDLLVKNGAQMVSVKPELRQSLGLDAKKGRVFRQLQEMYKQGLWDELIEVGSSARLLFPEEFSVEFLQPSDWDAMKKEAKQNTHRPELAMGLAILAAEEVHFLPEGEVRIRFPIPAIQQKTHLPERDHMGD